MPEVTQVSRGPDMRGRVVVLSGATKNIGLATAKTLARAGAQLVLCARSSGPLNDLANELNAAHGDKTAVAVAGDVTVAEDVAALARPALAAYGGVDVVINNALVDAGHAPILEATDDDWRRGFEGYVQGPLRLIGVLRESMAARGHGAIVNVVSTAAFTPVRSLGAYGVSKAAMWSVTRYLARELAPAIRVNAVCPGTTSADGSTRGSAIWDTLLPRVPLARMGSPDDTAQAITFLCSDAAAYITGDVIFVDGGRVSLAGTHD
jgi:NAD(P)-dependent dehydrogenase (short-subunit alcohol dehydrogenase family)